MHVGYVERQRWLVGGGKQVYLEAVDEAWAIGGVKLVTRNLGGDVQMCPKCGGFIEKITITEPNEYYDLVKQLQTILAEGTMSLVRATCDLKAIGQNLPWPADYIEHVFECTSCGRKFRLAIETYHGSGGAWEVV